VATQTNNNNPNMPSRFIKSDLEIKGPILANWDQDLIATDIKFFRDWKIRYEGDRKISYPKSAKGDHRLLWIISLDALFFEFRQTHFTNFWANPINPIIRVVRAWGEFLPERQITVGEMRALLTHCKPDNPDFNNRQTLENIMVTRNASEYLTEADLVKFQCLKVSDPRDAWRP
jgi:hypothetical protein